MGCCFGKKESKNEQRQIEEGSQKNQPQNTSNSSQNEPRVDDNQFQKNHEQVEQLVADIVQRKVPLPEELDFHGWMLKDVDAVMPLYLQDRPENDICFIPGRGLHAQSGKPTIKPHIIEIFKRENLDFYIHHSGGRVTVNFTPGKKVTKKFKEVDPADDHV